MEDTIESLKIVITSNSKETTSDINELTSSLRALQSISKNINGLKSIYDTLQKISGLSFSNLASLTSALDSVNKVQMSIRKAKNINSDVSNTKESVRALPQVESYTKLNKSTKFKVSTDAVDNTPIIDSKPIVDQSPQIIKTTESIKKMGEQAAKTKVKMNMFTKSLVRIVMYRLIRTALKAIINTIKKGLSDLATFDRATTETIAGLQADYQYFADSLAAIISPMLQAISPVVDKVTEALVAMNNQFAKLFANLAGNNYFNSATKSVEAFTRALLAAKTQATGIDELNILTTNTASKFDEVSSTMTVLEEVKTTLAAIGLALLPIFAILLKFKGLAVAFNVTGILGIIIAISVVLYEVYQKSESFRDSVKSILNTFITLGTSISSIIDDILLVVIQLVEDLMPTIVTLVELVANFIAEALPAITVIVGYVAELLQTLVPIVALLVDELAPIVSDILIFALDIVNELIPVIGIVIQLIKGILEAIMPVINILIDVLQPILKVIFVFIEEHIGALITVLTTVLTYFKDMLSTMVKLIKDVFSGDFSAVGQDLVNMFKLKFDLIKNLGSNLFNGLVKIASATWDSLKTALATPIEWIKSHIITPVANAFSNLGATIKSAWESVWTGIANFMVNRVNDIIGGFEAMLNGIINGINTMMSGIIAISNFFGSDWEGIPSVSYDRLPAFANGGFPENGLFAANNKELVGKFTNGKTAVANNEEITTGIYNAVLQAMIDSNANSESNSGSTIKVYLDSTEISAKIKQSNSGADIFKGGVLNGSN